MGSLPFDLSSLSDDSQRLLCESLVARGHAVFESIAAAYLGKRQRPPVSITLPHSPLFNASAHVVGKHHFIDINIATVLLLQVLFQKLLSSSSVVPELAPSPDRMRNRKAPFIRDLGNSSVDAELEISLDLNRHSVAVVLQDFCAWFIVLHEISHLICGHCQGMRHFLANRRCMNSLESNCCFRGGVRSQTYFSLRYSDPRLFGALQLMPDPVLALGRLLIQTIKRTNILTPFAQLLLLSQRLWCGHEYLE
jgi:hypothetical protein